MHGGCVAGADDPIHVEWPDAARRDDFDATGRAVHQPAQPVESFHGGERAAGREYSPNAKLDEQLERFVEVGQPIERTVERDRQRTRPRRRAAWWPRRRARRVRAVHPSRSPTRPTPRGRASRRTSCRLPYGNRRSLQLADAPSGSPGCRWRNTARRVHVEACSHRVRGRCRAPRDPHPTRRHREHLATTRRRLGTPHRSIAIDIRYAANGIRLAHRGRSWAKREWRSRTALGKQGATMAKRKRRRT